MKISLKIITLFLVILASSCKKDIEEKQNKIILLTKPSGWLTVKVEEKPTSSNNWNDITSNIIPFDADNLLIFDPYYVWAINEGALKLPGDAQVPFSGTWSFVDNESKIQLHGSSSPMEITDLTETSLQTIVVTANGMIRYTYKHP